MVKQVSAEELQQIISIIERYANGVGLDALFKELSFQSLAISQRTLKRRLVSLIEQGRVERFGDGRATRYRVPIIQKALENRESSIAEAVEASIPASPEGKLLPIAWDTFYGMEATISASPEGEWIRAQVRQPLTMRKPVGYRQTFLDAYRPNETQYLSNELRQHLHKIGRSPDANQPAGTYARHIYQRLLIDLSWNSSRLEGNTYSRLDTERLIAEGQVAQGKATQETQMILNHKEAIELLVSNAEIIGFNSYTILNLHALLANNLLSNQAAGGRLRQIQVDISGTVYLPLSVPQQVEEYFQQILETTNAIHDPFEQAFFVMVHLPYLQPFEDVNKRVSRLAANIPLIKYNYAPLSFIDVPKRSYIDALLGIYELNRIELLRDVFVWAYERSCARYLAVRESLGEPDPFRLRHRQALGIAVNHIVKNALSKDNIQLYLEQSIIDSVKPVERTQFLELVLSELNSLHQGNIARYRLTPNEYDRWQQGKSKLSD